MKPRTVNLLVLLLTLCGAIASAQSPLRPDAVILVQPYKATAEIAVVYPKPVSHTDAVGRVRKLASIAGWTAKSVSVLDREISLGGGTAKQAGKPVGKQTEVTASLAPAPQIAGNAFVLQPYLEAFSDLSRIELLYVFPRDARFNGLREYDSPELSLRLINPGGPYRYVVDFKKHGGKIASVPLTQPAAGVAAAAPRGSDSGSPAPARSDDSNRLLLIIFGIAAISGISAYGLLRLWGRRHHASVNLTGSSGRLSRL